MRLEEQQEAVCEREHEHEASRGRCAQLNSERTWTGPGLSGRHSGESGTGGEYPRLG